MFRIKRPSPIKANNNTMANRPIKNDRTNCLSADKTDLSVRTRREILTSTITRNTDIVNEQSDNSSWVSKFQRMKSIDQENSNRLKSPLLKPNDRRVDRNPSFNTKKTPNKRILVDANFKQEARLELVSPVIRVQREKVNCKLCLSC